ncbi:Leucine-rich repeat-containing N-terminal, plant-type [Sesbania bispinosa]|nr:Leucine-rich repeat-containing N-terminal, plant-type [Sesbania bispinosa]
MLLFIPNGLFSSSCCWFFFRHCHFPKQRSKCFVEVESQPLLSSWTGNNSCNWLGITCEESESVSKVNLINLGLRGTLQSLNFSLLPNILTLDISHNSFNGSIPNSIGKLVFLSHLDVGNNKLSRDIPNEIWNLRNLKYLALDLNNFNGSIIAQEIVKLYKIETLDLGDSGLSATSPILEELSKLGNLTYLSLTTCNLTEPIPRNWEVAELRVYTSFCQRNLGPHSEGNWRVGQPDGIIPL